MLDEPDKVWLEEETPVISGEVESTVSFTTHLPPICHVGKWSLSDIQKSVRMLNTVSGCVTYHCGCVSGYYIAHTDCTKS